MSGENKAKILDVVNRIVTEYEPEKVVLFGSYAWGSPLPDSDVDLLVIKDTEKRRMDRVKEIYEKAFDNNSLPVDLLVYTPEEMRRRLDMGDYFFEDISERGEVLYDRSAGVSG